MTRNIPVDKWNFLLIVQFCFASWVCLRALASVFYLLLYFFLLLLFHLLLISLSGITHMCVCRHIQLKQKVFTTAFIWRCGMLRVHRNDSSDVWLCLLHFVRHKTSPVCELWHEIGRLIKRHSIQSDAFHNCFLFLFALLTRAPCSSNLKSLDRIHLRFVCTKVPHLIAWCDDSAHSDVR